MRGFRKDGTKLGFQKGHVLSVEAEKRRRLSLSMIMKGKVGNRKGLLASAETKRRMSEAKKGKPIYKNRGKNHWAWKGNTSQMQAIRNSLEYKLWRTAVYERDDYACQKCGARNGNGKRVILNADHIKEFCKYPELRFEVTNGMTLCIDCHKLTPNYAVNARYL